MSDKIEHIRQYYQKVKSANKELTKKEAFKDLLNRIYIGNAEIQEIIDKITLGAEATVLNIPRKDKLHTGRADTLYNNIIIEFENDLRKTCAAAKAQLAGYMLGKMRSGHGYDFTLIASDFINWKIFVPDISCIDKLETLQEHELILNETDFSFSLTENNSEDFYFWLDRFLFRETKQRATLKSIEQAFGFQSNIFIESFRELNYWFNDAKKYGEIQVSFDQWHKFLSIAYGQFEKREDAFLIHSYLSVFSKMLAYSVMSNDEYIEENEMLNILNGSIFQKFNITNFVDNDFFYWISDNRNFPKLKKLFRLVAQELSAFDFENVNEDILKGVYQELIDIDTRHQLGEYYTPDWLCERIVSEFDFSKCKKILDPSCGSGSFLRAAIQRIKQQNPEKTPEEINKQIYGIDIHPLSVQIAKATVLLALGKDVINSRKPVFLNILLANTLDSYFLYEFFDYVIGNPPWFTYSSIKNEDYQNVLNKLADKYCVKPIPKNLPHLEIAAIFLAHCSSYFLKETGKLAFVLPRSFFSGDQHDRTRSGETKGIKLTEIWDLNHVQPLFNIPSCVFFAEKKKENQNGKITVIEGKQFAGRLPVHNCHYDLAETRLKETSVKWYLKTQGRSTAFSTTKSSIKNVGNPYKVHFKQGATIVPRAFYFIDLNQIPPKDFVDRIINIKTSDGILPETKAPWKMTLSGQVESKFLFRTAISKSILPFFLHQPALITLPITVEEEDGLKRIKLHTSEQLMNAGELKAWRWFENAETIWNMNKTEKSGKMTASDRIDFQKGLTAQNLNKRYLVLYTASAKDAHVLVLDRLSLDFVFLAESKTYVYYTDNQHEAYYLATILNSSIPNRRIKDFQTRGLFGPRDIHKKILDVYFPKFNDSDKQHLRLSELGKTCVEKAKMFVENNPPQNDLSAHSLGKLRVEIKKYLSQELAEIDRIVEKIMK